LLPQQIDKDISRDRVTGWNIQTEFVRPNAQF